jgi:hypothetical protein
MSVDKLVSALMALDSSVDNLLVKLTSELVALEDSVDNRLVKLTSALVALDISFDKLILTSEKFVNVLRSIRLITLATSFNVSIADGALSISERN